jgi:hypothetical protein
VSLVDPPRLLIIESSSAVVSTSTNRILLADASQALPLIEHTWSQVWPFDPTNHAPAGAAERPDDQPETQGGGPKLSAQVTATWAIAALPVALLPRV